MNLIINCLPNDMGEMLLKRAKDEYGAIEKKFMIKGKEYLKISLLEKGGKITRVLNQNRAIENCFDQEALAGILASNKIPFGDNNETIIKDYELFVFDLKTIFIKIKTNTKSKPIIKYVKESEGARSVEIARRVIYLLGLDFGVVHLALTARRRFRVTAVDPTPNVREKDFNTFYKRIVKLYNIGNELLTNETKLGADPEFMMINNKSGRLVSASQFFPRDGMVGCDNIRIPNRQMRPIAEIRPAPETKPLELMDNIKRALNNANRIAPHRNVRWVAGSQPVSSYCIGGHIHFSHLSLNYAVLRALDNYLGITVFLLEVPGPAAKRRRKYGFLADYRVKEYGGFEYRTPGSWLVSQKIATAVICLAKIIASRYLFLDKNFLNNADAQYAFYQGNQDYFRPVFHELWRSIEKTDMYEKYAEELAIIPYMVDNNLNWDEKSDFRKSWRLINPKKGPNNPRKTGRTNVQPKIVPRRSSSVNSSASAGESSSPVKKPKATAPKAEYTTNLLPDSMQRRSISTGRIVISNQIRGL